jgi:hypothetical protein
MALLGLGLTILAACSTSNTADRLPETVLTGCVKDLNESPLDDRVVVLFVNGVEFKRDITGSPRMNEKCDNFALSIADELGLYEKYSVEFGRVGGARFPNDPPRLLDLGGLIEEEMRYFFIDSQVPESKSDELIVYVVPGHPSTVEPERMNIASGEYQARQILYDQVKFWTRIDSVSVERLPFLSTWVEEHVYFYLTYLSPQLVQAAIKYRAVSDGLSEHEVTDLVREVNLRLRESDSLGFILRVVGNYPGISAEMGTPLQSNIRLVNTFGDSFSSLEYDRVFDYPIEANQYVKGYLFFPRSQAGKISVDLDTAPSIFVRIDEVHVRLYDRGGYGEWAESASIAWRYDLVPIDFPLEDLASRPEPISPQSLGLGDVVDIVGLVLDFASLLAK